MGSIGTCGLWMPQMASHRRPNLEAVRDSGRSSRLLVEALTLLLLIALAPRTACIRRRSRESRDPTSNDERSSLASISIVPERRHPP
jgi:hypothetical protein